ncbi:MAG: VacJ family lipoprotein [Alphaproteobacteria bacterium]|nr:VacJ family lipoprotein [Alphaproteobacteria bacterium]
MSAFRTVLSPERIIASSLLAVLLMLAPVARAEQPTSAQAGGDIYDPLEPMNRYFFEVNRFLDTIALKPMAAWYGMLPQGVRTGTGNFLGNLRNPWTAVNDGLQGEGSRAGTAVARFFINTLIGFFGVFDPAAGMGLKPHEEDAGQTFGSWGVGDGPYLMLPLFGPSNGRDVVGLVTDSVLDPFNLVTRANDLKWAPFARGGATAVHNRDANGQQIDDLERTATDLYATVRRITVERRRAEIRNAAPGSNTPSPRMTDADGPVRSGPSAEVPR